MYIFEEHRVDWEKCDICIAILTFPLHYIVEPDISSC